MNKLNLMRNPIVFQGEKYLNNSNNYFEGWYFKNTNKKSISFIPGISINEKERKAFIQVITNDNSYYIEYDIEKFKFSYNPFYIEIDNNYFSLDKIKIDINDKKLKLCIKGELEYSNHVYIETSRMNPNIMGPFSYIPFMECNHAILSMKHEINGKISINNKIIKFDKGIGYIEKDWGISFPRNYIWLQANNFENKDTSFMLSVANIPFKVFEFKGLICVLIYNNKEYKFTTYNNSKVVKCDLENGKLKIILKRKNYYLYIESLSDISHNLCAPIDGKMIKNIKESISSQIILTLKKKDKIIFTDSSQNCGLEIVK